MRKGCLSARGRILASAGLFIVYCLLFTISQAQPFKAGLLAGLATSQVDGDGFAGYNKAGMFAGGFVSKKFSPESKWTGMFEITYIQKGSKKNPIYRVKLNYAEVPLLVKYDFIVSDSANGSRTNFGVLGGIAIGTLVKSEESDAFGVLTGGTPFQKVDVSYVLGLSYALTEHIGFEARIEYSLIPVRKGGSSTYYPNWTSNVFKPGYYNNLLVFAFRYRI